MKKVLIILLVTLNLVICYEDDADYEGGNCTTYTNEPGVCRYLYECEYAIDRLKRKLKMKDCKRDIGIKRLVCCKEATTTTTKMPKEPPEPITDELFVKMYKEGRLKYGNIECRFNGTFPITCSRNRIDFTTLRFNEPSQCTELEKPYARSNLSPHESVIYDACYSYSRLGSKCILNEMYTDYQRDDCQRFKSTPKISDGDPAKAMEFPHMAVLGGKKKPNLNIVWFGGGSLISEYFILTAAHALLSRDDGPVRYVLMGTLNKNDTRSGDFYHVVQRIPHPEFVAKSKRNDIALLKLHKRVTFSDFIRPACLTFPGTKESEVNATIVAGWGKMGYGNTTSDILLKAIVYQEYDHSQCPINLHGRFFNWDSVTMICAKSKGLRRAQDTCEGDSGGPMMTVSNRYVPCSYFISGIISWGPRCGTQMYGSYTNASNSKYQEWIVQNVWPLQLDAKNLIS